MGCPVFSHKTTTKHNYTAGLGRCGAGGLASARCFYVIEDGTRQQRSGARLTAGDDVVNAVDLITAFSNSSNMLSGSSWSLRKPSTFKFQKVIKSMQNYCIFKFS